MPRAIAEVDLRIPNKLWSDGVLKVSSSRIHMCHGQTSRFFGDGRPPTFNRNPYNGYINPYYWVDDHPLLYGNNGSLDPGTYKNQMHFPPLISHQIYRLEL